MTHPTITHWPPADDATFGDISVLTHPPSPVADDGDETSGTTPEIPFTLTYTNPSPDLVADAYRAYLYYTQGTLHVGDTVFGGALCTNLSHETDHEDGADLEVAGVALANTDAARDQLQTQPTLLGDDESEVRLTFDFSTDHPSMYRLTPIRVNATLEGGVPTTASPRHL